MSLIMALETYEGIVMTADRLSTLSYFNDKTQTTDAFPKTYYAHKLFLTKNGYGISTCGDAKVENEYLLEQFISEEICTKDFSNLKPMEIARSVLDICMAKEIHAILLFCGYTYKDSFTIEINCKKKELYNYPDSSRKKIVRYGDTAITDSILDSKFYYGYSAYRLQDAVNLLKYVNEVTARLQQFQEVLQTVSEECDILILYKNHEHLWLNKNELHI